MIRARSTAALRAIAVATALLAPAAARAGLPEWAKTIASAAPPLPEGSPEWPSRTLYSEVRLTVVGDGKVWRIRERRAIQYLSNRVEDTAYGFFAWNGDTKMKTSKGWHLPLGERAQRSFGAAVDIGMTDTFDTDAKARAVALEGVRRGSLVFFEFDAERHPYTLSESFGFGGAWTPMDRERVLIELPTGWQLKWAWLRTPGADPVRDGTTWTFEQAGLVPPKEEPLGPSPSDLTPRLVVTLEPPDGAAPGAPVVKDWGAMGRWFQTVAKGRDAVEPAISRASGQALSAAGSEPLARMRAATLYVRDKVRYISRAVGVGGYVPRPAGQVLSELDGDCKDKGTLLRAMLAADGFTSFPMLVNAEDDGTVADAVPDLGAFDHFVVGILWPKETPVPGEIAGSTVAVPDLGTVFVVDATDEYAWPGVLPAVLAGRRALLVTPDGGRVVELPAGTPDGHRIETTAAISMRADRATAVSLDVRYRGWPAETARASYAKSAVDRRKAVEEVLRRHWPAAQVSVYRVVPETPDGAFTETIELEAPPSSSAADDVGVAMFAGATEGLTRVPLGKRTQPVVFPSPLELRYESTVSGATAETGLPIAQHSTGDGWDVTSEFRRDGGAIHGVWSCRLSRTRFAPEAFPELKSLWSAASKAASPSIRVAR